MSSTLSSETLKNQKSVGRNCLRSSSFDSEGSSLGVQVRRSDDRQWRKFGILWRQERLRADEDSRGSSFMINQACPIERYYEIAARIFDQFLESIQSSDQLEESYLSGNRLMKFLSASLPTHRQFYSKDPLLSKLRINSRNDLTQLGVLVEEVALKIDKGIYEDYLWGNVPDSLSERIHNMEPTLHPLIFDDDQLSRRSCKKVTFSLANGDDAFNELQNEKFSVGGDSNNSFSSGSTSTTEISGTSFSSPELLNHDELYDPLLRSSGHSSLIESNKTFRPKKDSFWSETADEKVNNIKWCVGSGTTKGGSRPAEFNESMNACGGGINRATHLRYRINYGNINEAFGVHIQKVENHQSHVEKARDVMESCFKENVGAFGDEGPVLKQSATWDSCDDDDLDHAVYVKKLTQLEFVQKQSPPRLSKEMTASRRTSHGKMGPRSSKQVEDNTSHTCMTETRRERIEDIFMLNGTNIRIDTVDPGDVTVHASHDKNGYDEAKEYMDGMIDQAHDLSSDSSSTLDEDLSLDDVGSVIGIARREDLIILDDSSHVEHIQYLQDRLLSDEPETNERSWGKTWLRRSSSSISNHNASISHHGDLPHQLDPLQQNWKGSTLLSVRLEEQNRFVGISSLEEGSSACSDPYHLKYSLANMPISKDSAHVSRARELLSHNRKMIQPRNEGGYDAPDDELMHHRQ